MQFEQNGKQVIVGGCNHHFADIVTEEGAALTARSLNFYASTMPWRASLELNRDALRMMSAGAIETLRSIGARIENGALTTTDDNDRAFLLDIINTLVMDGARLDISPTDAAFSRPLVNQHGETVGGATVSAAFLAQVAVYTDDAGVCWVPLDAAAGRHVQLCLSASESRVGTLEAALTTMADSVTQAMVNLAGEASRTGTTAGDAEALTRTAQDLKRAVDVARFVAATDEQRPAGEGEAHAAN